MPKITKKSKAAGVDKKKTQDLDLDERNTFRKSDYYIGSKNNNNIEEESHQIITVEPEENQIFALPSELPQKDLSHLLAEDGHLKKATTKIIQKGSKLKTESTTTTFDKKAYESRLTSHIGRKGATGWSRNIKDLRKRFGISWQKIGRRFLIPFVVIGILLAMGIVSLTAMVINYYDKVPSIRDIQRDPIQNSVVYARDGVTKIYEFFQEERREVIDTLDEIPLVMQLAVIALEDENYYDPNNDTGIPWRNLAGAMTKCVISLGNNCRGASGLSQQLIKNMTGDDEQSIERKIRELFIAVKLNDQSSKSEILLSYLNWVSFGRNSYGVQQASRSYFGKPVNQKDPAGNFTLTAPEACYMAAMTRQPGLYPEGIDELPQLTEYNRQNKSPNENTDEVIEDNFSAAAKDLEFRKNACLQKLHDLEFPLEDGFSGNYIKSDDELQNLLNSPVTVTTDQNQANELRTQGQTVFVNTVINDPYPHFREYIKDELEKFMDERELYEVGYDIVTTIDPNLQAQAEEIIRNSENTITQYGANNAAAMIMDGTNGQIMAMVGSLGYDRTEEGIDGKVNITTSAQQPGSSIKPYVYAQAFLNGFNPGSVIIDVETDWQGYRPKNFDGGFRGPVTMRRALQGSLNIPAVKTLFLTNNEPSWNVTSKLDSFFSFSESVGVRFPCVEGATNQRFVGIGKPDQIDAPVENCEVTRDSTVTQADIDSAYRGRCFIASVLGGCEVTMVSHVTGFNTFLQEGRVRTATPFISITRKRDGEDIYAKRQCLGEYNDPNTCNPEQAPYPWKRDDQVTEEMRLLSRQMTNVLTDDAARIPEFGSLRSNLQMSLPGWYGLAAAKTGTSNGPKDFWTIGGTPYYSIGVWVGRTKNEDMFRFASSSRAAAPIWKSLMDMAHTGLEPKGFSTEGLQSLFVNTTTGTPPSDEDGQSEEPPRPSGVTELLTPWQINALGRATGRVAINDPEELEELKKKSIIDNRTTVIPVTYAINSKDNKLFNPELNLENFKEDVECTLLLPEFPEDYWRLPVEAWMNRSDSYCKFPERSNEDQKSNPELEINFDTSPIALNNGSILSISSINFTPSFLSSSDKQIVKVEVYLNGILQVSGTTSATLNLGSLTDIKERNNIIIYKVTDTEGQEYSKTYRNITIRSNNSSSDLSVSNIILNTTKCDPTTSGTNTVCSFTVNKSPASFDSLEIRIGTSTPTTCAKSPITEPLVNCAGVATRGLEAGPHPIYIILNGAVLNTGKQVILE